MPVGQDKKKPKNAKSLKKRLDEKVVAGDDKAICHLVKEDLGVVGGSAQYYNTPIALGLTKDAEYIVFIIGGGFTVGESDEIHTGDGVGHPVWGESVLTLQPRTVVVVISGY